jgi:hypothetical protein
VRQVGFYKGYTEMHGQRNIKSVVKLQVSYRAWNFLVSDSSIPRSTQSLEHDLVSKTRFVDFIVIIYISFNDAFSKADSTAPND